MFRQCERCDFEWHLSDGKACPACGAGGGAKTKAAAEDSEDESDSARRAERSEGGAFGSGPHAKGQASCVVALAIMALIYFLVAYVLPS